MCCVLSCFVKGRERRCELRYLRIGGVDLDLEILVWRGSVRRECVRGCWILKGFLKGV